MNFTQEDTANMIARDRIASQLILFATDHLKGSSWKVSIDRYLEKVAYLDEQFRKTLVEESHELIFDENYNEIENEKYDPAKGREMRKAACDLIDALFLLTDHVQAERKHIIETEVQL